MDKKPEGYAAIDALLEKYFSGTLTDQDKAALDDWIAEKPSHRHLLELMEGRYLHTAKLAEAFDYDKERVWRAILKEERALLPPSRRRRIVSIAACFAIAMIAGYIFLRPDARDMDRSEAISLITPGGKNAVLNLSDGRTVVLDGNATRKIHESDNTMVDVDAGHMTVMSGTAPANDTPLMETLSVPAGGEFSLTLADGTRVWLNSESSIVFPTRFALDSREVLVTGEAYFEVMKDESRPFRVKAGQQIVTVLGTSFNILAYGDQAGMETTLVSGSVEIRSPGGKATLIPNEQSYVDNTTGGITVRTIDAGSVTAWRNGNFVFIEEPLPSICKKLSRWYDVEIDASAEGLAALRYSGSLLRSETLNTIADILSATGQIEFIMDEGKIIVRLKP